MRRPRRARDLRNKQELGGEHLSSTEGPSEGCSCLCLVALQRLSVPGPPKGQLPLQRAGAAHRVAVTEEALDVVRAAARAKPSDVDASDAEAKVLEQLVVTVHQMH